MAIAGLTSCQNSDPISSEYDTTNFDYVSFGTLVEQIDLSTPSLDQPMYVENSMDGEKIRHGGMFGGNTPMYRFHHILDSMDLTEEQLASIDAFFALHIDCVTSARQTFANAVASIVEAANIQRQAIIDQYKAGEIDRETAKILLNQLKIDTKTQIEESGAKDILLAALKLCTDSLIENIKSVLTEEQLTLFEEWLANQPEPGEGGNRGEHGHHGGHH
ncbi:MAG: hypothetical protein A2X64_06610 [Ignavibacteria bacterium GWF2_33_9]|nr:MAG: hypothetical protein A2X64_06610 [Ignavibacteria bacterium GWF2_33_9]